MPKRRRESRLPDPGPRPPEDNDLTHFGGPIDSIKPRNPELVEWERRVASIVDGASGPDAHSLLAPAGMWPPTMLPEEVDEVTSEFRGEEVVLHFHHDVLAHWARLHGGRYPFESRYSRGVLELERDRRRYPR